MEEISVNSHELPRRSRGGESTNLRDLLKVREDEATTRNRHRGERNEAMTLATVLACEKHPVPPGSSAAAAAAAAAAPASGGQRLLDVIRLDENLGRSIATSDDRRSNNHPTNHGGISWKAFKSLLRRTATWPNSSGSTSSNHHLASPAMGAASGTPTASANPNTIGEVGLNWRITFREHMEMEQSPVPRERPEEGPIRVSLLALLEEADRSGGGGGGGASGGTSFATALMGVSGEEEEEEDANKGGDNAGTKVKDAMYVCCVCMVRHKGAAFIPCGHTFCRLCSRELWVSRGNCPLCNGFILEILDIF